MDIHKRVVLIRDSINDQIKRFQNVLPALNNILSKIEESETDPADLPEALDVLHSRCNLSDEAIKSVVQGIDDVWCIFKPTIEWHSNKKEMLEMFYLDGNSPWSIWLTYNPSRSIDNLYKNLERRHSDGLLKKLKLPKVGDFICCCDRKVMFRAVIIGIINNRIKVINVDRYSVKIVRLEACYEITKDLCNTHAYSIQCCLTKDRKFEKKWNEDLGRLLQNTLKECRLTVKIVDEIQSLPPIFLVQMYAFNEALEAETDVGVWITSQILLELDNLSGESDNVLEYISDQALDPFFCVPSGNVLQSTFESNSLKKNKLNNAQTSLSPLDGLLEQAASAIQSVTLQGSKIGEKPRNRLAHLINSSVDESKPILNGCSKPEIVHSTNNVNSKIDFSNIYPSNSAGRNFKTGENEEVSQTGPCYDKKTGGITDVSRFKDFFDLISRKEHIISSNYIPSENNTVVYASKGFRFKRSCKKQHIIVKKGPDDKKIQGGITDVNRTNDFFDPTSPKKLTIPSNYVPSEDKGICQFYASEGYYCWKQSCKKQHINMERGTANESKLKEISDVNGSNDFFNHIPIEDPVIPDNIIPTDETRICEFFSKKGYCWKPSCIKEHTVVDKGTANENKLKEMSDVNGSNDFFNHIPIENPVIPENHIPADETRICEFFAKKGYCWKPSCKKEHTIVDKGTANESTLKEISDVNGPNDFFNHIPIEDPVIPDNYIPTDETRICEFFAKKGYCWKPSCKKEHNKVDKDKWTEDCGELYGGIINSLAKPKIGSTITLKVSHVIFSNMFYSILPDIFSGTEQGCETADSLISKLNSPEAKNEFKLFKTSPCFGQLIIAYCRQKSLWMRAAVQDITENNFVQVFFIDLGITEEVTFEDCREIGPEYVHLPCQAVQCRLANIYVEGSQVEEGKTFLENLLVDKEIEAQLVNCNIINNEIEIVALLQGININQLMVDKGFCLPFSRE